MRTAVVRIIRTVKTVVMITTWFDRSISSRSGLNGIDDDMMYWMNNNASRSEEEKADVGPLELS